MEKFFDINKMEPRRGFVKDIEGASRVPLGKFP